MCLLQVWFVFSPEELIAWEMDRSADPEILLSMQGKVSQLEDARKAANKKAQGLSNLWKC